jgi:hypothetical protein
MKAWLLLLPLLCSAIYPLNHITAGLAAKKPHFNLFPLTTWNEYPCNTIGIHFDKEKWVWTHSMIIKSKNPLKLENIILQWNGGKLPKLSASLYQKKERDEKVIPIQENLVAEGNWDQKKQQLTFALDEKIIATSKLHLVLSYPKNEEARVKKGNFVIAQTKVNPIKK